MSKWRPVSEKPQNFSDGEIRWVLVEHSQPKGDIPYSQPFIMAYWDSDWKCWIDTQGNDPTIAYKPPLKPIRWMNLPRQKAGNQ